MKVAGYVTRKTLLYKTGVEYGDYTMNHVQGCAHGCRYPCYAYLMARRFGKVKTLAGWRKPYLVRNTLQLLKEELPRLKHKIKSVHLCFTTDPFMYGFAAIARMSVAAIAQINKEGLPCSVLTKGVLPKSLARLSKENAYGITLITLDEGFRKVVEPGAAPISRRIAALRALSDAGCRTWVSIEPYPTPNVKEQDLVRILEEISFVDKIIFGRAHYNRKISAYKNCKKFYNEQAKVVIDFCNTHGIVYHIKKGTVTSSLSRGCAS